MSPKALIPDCAQPSFHGYQLRDGPEAVETYLEELKYRFGGEDSKASSLIKGVRYPFEDDHRGKMLEPAFISSLQWLSRRGRTFDMTFEPRKKTPWQLIRHGRAIERSAQGRRRQRPGKNCDQ